MNSQALSYTCLLLSTVISMNVLVVEEEVLVLLCWLLFISLACTYGSSAINGIFEERREIFCKDMDLSFFFQEEALKVIINYHRIQLLIIFEIMNLFHFSRSEITRIIIKRQLSFKFLIASQIEQKLLILVDKEASMEVQVQNNISLTVSNRVLNDVSMLLVHLFKSKNKQIIAFKKNLLSESITKFKTIASA
jgi:hypothetical protein